MGDLRIAAERVLEELAVLVDEVEGEIVGEEGFGLCVGELGLPR